MKKVIAGFMSIILVTIASACSAESRTSLNSENVVSSDVQLSASQEETISGEEISGTENSSSIKKVAKDDAVMQADDPEMPTRVIENGTKVNMRFGDTVIPGVLNDSETAQALIAQLPYTVHMNSYSHDFCGTLPEDFLPYNEDEVHYGWLNGDIDYAIDAPYFTILHSDEENSEQYGYQVNIGVITCELSKIRELSGGYDVVIELAE